MELHQVRYFVTLCRTLNFTRAAAECNVTQPALTRAIQRLEDELGGALLFRERSLTQLTPLGRAMVPHLQAMLAAAETARRVADEQMGRQQMNLRVGLGPAIAAARVADVVGRLTRVCPDLAVRFEEADAAALVEQLMSDMLDCALLPDAPDLPGRLHRWKLCEERCVVVMPAGHPLAAQDSLQAEDLAGETLLVGERCGGFALRLIESSARTFTVRRCGGSWVQMLDLVAAGLGLALLPDALAIGTGLVSRPLAEPVLHRSVLLALVAGRPQGSAVANFVKLCRARAFA
ncbi:MAG: LysR family transcriptional regulator [Rhodospirillales bacterium]|jgi:DNA-binding transcriptional LysR family regulator|nr:LysR family transcriptional regulator [Rhodospirillales bacterium]